MRVALLFHYALMRILMYILAGIALMLIGVQVATTMSTSRTKPIRCYAA